MRLYLSGPITTETSVDLAHLKFDLAERRLKEFGFKVCNPFDVQPESCIDPDLCALGPRDKTDAPGHDWTCWIRWDLIEMLRCDGVALLPNFQRSKGSRAETDTARIAALPVKTINEWIDGGS